MGLPGHVLRFEKHQQVSGVHTQMRLQAAISGTGGPLFTTGGQHLVMLKYPDALVRWIIDCHLLTRLPALYERCLLCNCFGLLLCLHCHCFGLLHQLECYM
eukprot:GHUV01020548.1.p2 GENE.GHUV01020548.1~~GHUV01020548.1.p2  ORF type:complete len:101 (+),score=19.56 GHUV01020548.1:614-916(+)